MTTRTPPQAPDDEVRRAWREVSNEQPPERVDAAILAAARRAADPGSSSVVRMDDHLRTRRWFQRWQPALAAAGVCGLAFVLLQSLPRESGIGTMPTRPSPPEQSKATEAAATESRGPVDAQVPRSAEPQAAGNTMMETTRPNAPASPGRSMEAAVPPPAASGDLSRMNPAETPAPVAKAASRAEDAEASARTIAPAARGRAEADRSALGAMNESPGSAAADSVEVQIARIADLCDRGDRDGAAAELRRLRKQSEHADELLPERLRAWARTVE
jgi:hypothetical protein